MKFRLKNILNQKTIKKINKKLIILIKKMKLKKKYMNEK